MIGLLMKWRLNSFEDKIAQKRRAIIESLSLLGESDNDWTVCATFENKAVLSNKDGRLFEFNFSDPVKLIDMREEFNLKDIPNKIIKEHCKEAVNNIMVSKLSSNHVLKLSKNIDSLHKRVVWESAIKPKLHGGDWNVFFKANEAKIRSLVWRESKDIDSRRYDGVGLSNIKQWLIKERAKSIHVASSQSKPPEIRNIIHEMSDSAGGVIQGIDKLVEGRGDVNKTSDIIPVLVEYVGRIELMNAYANKVSH